MAIAQRLGLSDEEVEKIRISALLHDVGKISIDDKILKKPAALTDEEIERLFHFVRRTLQVWTDRL